MNSSINNTNTIIIEPTWYASTAECKVSASRSPIVFSVHVVNEAPPVVVRESHRVRLHHPFFVLEDVNKRKDIATARPDSQSREIKSEKEKRNNIGLVHSFPPPPLYYLFSIFLFFIFEFVLRKLHAASKH